MGGKGDTKQSNAAFNLSNEAAAIAQQLFQDTGPVRDALLDNILSALATGGVQPDRTGQEDGTQTGGTETGGTGPTQQDPATITLTSADLYDVYRRVPDGPGKLSDIPRILRNLPPEFTLEELEASANLSGLSTRSRRIFSEALNGLQAEAARQQRTAAAQSGVTFSPLIAAARDTTKAAGEASIKQLQEQLASANLLNTPFGQQALSNAQLASNQQSARIGPEVASRFIFDLAPGAAFGQLPTITGGLTGAAGVQAQTASALANAQNTGLGFGLGNAFGQLGAAAIPTFFGSGT